MRTNGGEPKMDKRIDKHCTNSEIHGARWIAREIARKNLVVGRDRDVIVVDSWWHS